MLKNPAVELQLVSKTKLTVTSQQSVKLTSTHGCISMPQPELPFSLNARTIKELTSLSMKQISALCSHRLSVMLMLHLLSAEVFESLKRLLTCSNNI
jgi:hypothetical protein